MYHQQHQYVVNNNNNGMYQQQQFQPQFPPHQQQTQPQPPVMVPQISVKVKIKDTIRRFSIPANSTLIQFYQLVSKSFQLDINSTTHLVQYKDNEEDLIVTTSEAEWTYAKSSFSTPCMQITLKEKVVTQKKVEATTTTTTAIARTPSLPQQQPPPMPATTATPPQQQQPIQPPNPIPQQQLQPQRQPSTAQVQQQQPIIVQQQQQPLLVQQTQPNNVVENGSQAKMEDSLGFVALNTSQQPSPYAARYSSDINLPDGSSIYINQQVTKRWKIINSGSVHWPSNVQLHCKDSKTLPFKITSSIVPAAAPNQSVEVSVSFIPTKVGPLKGYFKLCSGDIQFGHVFWLDLVVHQTPVAEAPQQQQQTTSINETIEQIRDLKIDDIKEFDSDDDEDSDDEEGDSKFEDERFNALKEKYQFQLEVLGNMGMTNQRTLVNILDQTGGDISATIQQFILLSSKME